LHKLVFGNRDFICKARAQFVLGRAFLSPVRQSKPAHERQTGWTELSLPPRRSLSVQ